MSKDTTETEDNDVSMEQSSNTSELSYDEKVSFCNVIAKPMASKKLAKKCYKLMKEAAKHNTYIRCGLKDVQTRIRKGETGIVIFAGDVSPLDIMCHLPAVCEQKSIPYVYVPSRKDLGAALGVKRGCLTVLIRPNNDYEELFNKLKTEIDQLAGEL